MNGRETALLFMQMAACLAPPNGGASPVPPTPPDPPTPDPPELDVVWCVMGTGQSLSVGSTSEPVITGYGSGFNNFKLGYDTGTIPWLSTVLVPLEEYMRPLSASPYPYNIQGQTVHTIMGAQISTLVQARTGHAYVTYHGAFGSNGWNMDLIEKNGVQKPPTPTDPSGIGYSYQAMLDELAIAIPLITAQENRVAKFRAGTLTHGESDYSSPGYGARVRTLQQNQKADLFALSGQPMTDPYSLIASQASGFPAEGSTGVTVSAASLWNASVQYPGEIVVSGPKYQYDYSPDNIHLTNVSENRLGVKYGQVYDALVRGTGWTPLQPNGITVLGSLITLTFDIPVTPLQWDETIVVHQVAHTEWANGRGFEVMDSTGDLTITSATIVGETVQILLASVPSTGLRVRYAMVNDGTGCRRGGQLVDSDPFVGVDLQVYQATMTNGSPVATILSPTFKHGPRDNVASGALLTGATILSVAGSDITMSQNWGGPSGTWPLTIWFDERNYLVQFDLAVPYAAP